MKFNLKNILKGTTPGQIQSVGVMQVIPLLSDIEYPEFISPAEGGKFKTSGYGKMTFLNDTNQIMLVPTHTTYLVKDAAQNHALPDSGFVARKKERTFENAACVQRTQGGYIPLDNYKFTILPFSLREVALTKRHGGSYDKLWSDITSFNKRLGVQANEGHLEFFFEKFKNELDQFIGEFETVPNQIGAIVLINGYVVGIDRAPTHAYWQSLWEPLIRGCYASLAIQQSLEKNIPSEFVENIRPPLDLTAAKSLEDLEEMLDEYETKQTEKVNAIIRNLLSEDFKETTEDKIEKFSRHQIDNQQFTGQVVTNPEISGTDDAAIVYASLITKDKWFQGAKWQKAKDFVI